MYDILLSKSKSLRGNNENMDIPVHIEQEGKLIDTEYITSILSQSKVYDNERSACTDVRLNVDVYPVCSNVLFNNATEIVFREGSNSASNISYMSTKEMTDMTNEISASSPAIIYKGSNFNWNKEEMIRDTQLSNSSALTYHCGIDMLNNYHLRTLSYKTVCMMKDKKTSGTFNTLMDMAREDDGSDITDYLDVTSSDLQPTHLFISEEIYTPLETYSNCLKEKEGWMGFYNSISMNPSSSSTQNQLHINATLNNKNSYDFINLFPEKDLFDFSPKWNDYKKRTEKNWNYCLTYPYSSTTSLSFIRQNTNSLYVNDIDEIADSNYILFNSVSKHGLNVGDRVSIYVGDEIKFNNVLVEGIGVYDTDKYESTKDYSFYIKATDSISNNWVQKDDESPSAYSESYTAITGVIATYGKGQYYTVDGNVLSALSTSITSYYTIYNSEYVNVDDDAQDISFKKIDNNIPCEYYVRINAKLPNFKNADIPVNEDTVKDDSFLQRCSVPSGNNVSDVFDNEIDRLAFSSTIYGDNMTEITYTDLASFAYLKDNRGKPLTSLFFTIVKANDGYKEWYGKIKSDGNLRSIVITGDNITYSHVFGKVSCAFELSEHAEKNRNKIFQSIHTINNVVDSNLFRDGSVLSGESISYLNGERDDTDENEINFYKDRLFYNDLVCYSSYDDYETSIQPMCFRFNTAQRELNSGDMAYQYFSSITFDNVVSDDYDDNGFSSQTSTYSTNICDLPEGYYYTPSYAMKVRSISSYKQTERPLILSVSAYSTKMNDTTVRFITYDDNYAELNDELILYSSFYGDKVWKISCIKVNSTTSFDGIVYDGETMITGDSLSILVGRINTNPNLFRYAKRYSTIPYNANLIADKGLSYVWRDIYPNGMGNDSTEEIYPYANKSLYIEKRINFFLKRQYDKRQDNIQADVFPYQVKGNPQNIYNNNKYVSNSDMECII